MINARAELLDIYRLTPVTLQALAGSLPDDIARRGGEGEEAWSVLEIVCHLRDAKERAMERVRLMRDEPRPALPAYDQAALARERHYREQSLDDALAAFVRLRAEHIALLEDLDPAA